MSEICKELIVLATRCRGTKPRNMTAGLMQEIVESLYQASTWIGISEMSHREDRAVINELRRQLGDENGRLGPAKCRGYSSPTRNPRLNHDEWDKLGKVKAEV